MKNKIKIFILILMVVMISSCALLDPHGSSYSPEALSPEALMNDYLYGENSNIITYTSGGEHHIIFR